MSSLVFRESDHTYWLDGQQIPSVTGLMKAAGLVELYGPAEQLDYARDRGTASHVATELDDLGTLDETSVVEDVWPYLEAWRRFRRESGFTPEHIELVQHHPTLRYAGTIDRIGRLPKHQALIDIKTGSPRAATGVQLAAYAAMAAANGLCKANIKRYACHLAGDGSYQLIAYTNPRDASAFAACLALHNWRAS